MVKAKLTKITSTHENLRTNDMVGTVANLPEIGKSLTIINNEPINKEADCRIITTTSIKECVYDERSETYTFKTQNSTYQLKVLEIIDDGASN